MVFHKSLSDIKCSLFSRTLQHFLADLNVAMCIIIIIGSSHGFPWPSLTIRFYRLALLVDLPGFILYRYKVFVSRPNLLIHLKESIGVHFLLVHPYFSRNIPNVLFVWHEWFSKWVVGDRTAAFLWDIASSFCSICSVLVELMSSFFSIRFVSFHVVHPYWSIDATTDWKKFCFNLSDLLAQNKIGVISTFIFYTFILIL